MKPMSTHLSRFFRQRREVRKLSFGDVARLLGYKNVAKGSNKVIKFERDGNIRPDLFSKLAAVLEISAEDIRRCIQEDKADWQRWSDEPIEPHLVARIMCAVYSTKRIPTELQESQEAMEEFASAFAKERQMAGVARPLEADTSLVQREGRTNGRDRGHIRGVLRAVHANWREKVHAQSAERNRRVIQAGQRNRSVTLICTTCTGDFPTIKILK